MYNPHSLSGPGSSHPRPLPVRMRVGVVLYFPAVLLLAPRSQHFLRQHEPDLEQARPGTPLQALWQDRRYLGERASSTVVRLVFDRAAGLSTLEVSVVCLRHKMRACQSRNGVCSGIRCKMTLTASMTKGDSSPPGRTNKQFKYIYNVLG